MQLVTFSKDTATGNGGAVQVKAGTVDTSDSIFSGSTCHATSGATYSDLGHNVASTHTCTTASTSISTSTTIGLGPLAANTSTGPETMAVTPQSSAFEVVASAACTVNTTERGLPRPGAPTKNCDAGAYEYQLTGYDMVGQDGGVFVFNPPGVSTKGFYGSLPGIHVVPNKPVVGIVPTVTDAGYFLVGADGGVYAFGNAPFLGSLPGIKVTPNLPIVGIVAANTDKGYFLVGADGGVYAFGTVPFLGSLPGKGISASNVIGIASTPTGSGYWVVQATGKVTSFGTAQSFTTTATTSPVTAIAGTPTGGGYWLSTKDGGVYPYGNAKKQGQGTLPAIKVTPNLPVIGIVRVADTVGYWLIGSDGGIFAFGTAPFVGSLPGLSVHVTDIVGAVPN
jgi:predicted outer membrane repeat protein